MSKAIFASHLQLVMQSRKSQTDIRNLNPVGGAAPPYGGQVSLLVIIHHSRGGEAMWCSSTLVPLPDTTMRS